MQKILASHSQDSPAETSDIGMVERISHLFPQMLVEVHREILEQLGYSIIAVRSGIEALELFNDNPEIFNLVITDHVMPGMTGIELSRKLLKIRADIPIILCTGLTKTTICQEAKDVGISEFVMKPIIMKDLAVLIWNVLK